MEYKLKAYTIWDCGKRVDAEGKPHQEDSIFPAHEQTTEQDRLFILCDGMGGHEAGEVASATVCEAMSKSILSAEPNAEGNFTDDTLFQALADAYNALDGKDNNTSGRKMGTTMTLLKLHNKGCTIAHIGDSRVYHIRPGKTAKDTEILFHTEDHSLVNELVKAGELTPEEAKMSRQKNVITRAMQPHLPHRPKADVYHTVDIRPNDYFYLCSDGMLENMEDHQLCYFFSEEAGDDPHKVSSLVKATQENSDNHSAIIVHISEVLNPVEDTNVHSEDVEDTSLIGEVHEEEVHEEEVHPMANATNKRTMPKPQKVKWLAGFGLLLLVCLVIVAIVVFFLKPSPGQVEEPEEPETAPIMSIPAETESNSIDTVHKPNTKPQPSKPQKDTEIESSAPDNQEEPTPVQDKLEELKRTGKDIINKLPDGNKDTTTSEEENLESV